MTTREKLLEKLQDTTTGWRFRDLRQVAESVGIEIQPGKGDHWKFRYPGKYPKIVVGKGGDEVLSVYVRNVRDLVEEILDERAQEGK